MKRLIFFLLIVALLMPTTSSLAQDDGSSSNPALAALMWGIDYFPYPEWQVTITTKPDEVTGSWTTSEQYPAVVFYAEQFPYDTFTGEDLSALATENWLNALMINYNSWTELTRCIRGDYLIVEMKATSDDVSYVSRYWIWSEGDRLKSVFAAFPRNGIPELQALANEYFPNVGTCSNG